MNESLRPSLDRRSRTVVTTTCVLASLAGMLAVDLAPLAAFAAKPIPARNAWIRPLPNAAPTKAEPTNTYVAAQGAFVFDGAPLRTIVAAAWGTHPRDVHFAEGLDGSELFAAFARPPAANTEAAFPRAQAQLRTQIRRSLGLDIRTEEIDGDVEVLRQISSTGWRLEASAEGGEGEEAAEARPGLFRARATSMKSFVRFLRTFSSGPIVDETGLEGAYDFVLEWDPRADQRALLDALGDIGLELTSEERRHRRLVVRPAGTSKGGNEG